MAPRTIGIDTGGTFTDLFAVEGEEVRVVKLPSTPADPPRAVVAGLALCGGARPGDHVVHGTTVALNALLTASTAPVAFVTSEGFRDLVEIGRQERPAIYALEPSRPAPLVPRRRRFEIPQRIWPSPTGAGFVTMRRPTAAELAALARRVRRSGARSVAVGLLHSWADPRIEEEVGAALAPLGLPVTLSAAILPEHREYERFSTALVNAALVPLMRDYLGSLAARLAPARLSILQSSGATLAAHVAAVEPVRVVLSGPAGGVVGAARAAAEAGLADFVALDMGGTSTDVAFHRARTGDGPRHARRRVDPVRIAGHPIAVPALDIHTIGCGGGSLVTVDAGGILHVGPESAGADPGPVCYGRSDRLTVTDAHVLLGHIAEGPFLAGQLPLDTAAVARAFSALGRRLGVEPAAAARGILEVARAAMGRAIGVMTMQRGQDPARLTLVAFGGAGGLHGAALAATMGMPGALIPRHPGALSARGMTSAEAARDHTQTVLAPLVDWPRTRRRQVLDALAERGRAELVADGHAAGSLASERSLDLRYAGQSFELQVPEGPDPAAAFHAAHAALYGWRLEEREIELVCLRARTVAPTPAPVLPRVRPRPFDPSAVRGHRLAVFDRPRRAPVIDRELLRPGHSFPGPALVEEYSGTTLVPPSWRARVTAGGHLRLDRALRGPGTPHGTGQRPRARNS
ncbi:MAG: hydantoinase/oxoprolinase family protein [Planctomycetota bacterium]